MKKILFLLSIVWTSVALASGGGAHLDRVDIDISDNASLQKGAKYYVNYCYGCHSLKFLRYNRLAKDLGIAEQDVIDNLMFSGSKIADPMEISMTKEDANNWFGVQPPDLSLIARSRGTDWLYTYLRSFYADDSRPFGVNNTLFKDVGMPHVLSGLQGLKAAPGAEGEHAEMLVKGTLSEKEYDQVIHDIVGFLEYAGEPAKLKRQTMGLYVLLFLAFFTLIAYLLKKEYWRDVH